MLRFFRKMRQALIPENRQGRYFLYAAGEILLVVIGILIALGIDNWNENRNRVSEVQKHLVTLSQNLEEDMAQMKQLNASMDTIIRYGYALTDQFKTLQPVDINTQLYMIYLLFEYNLNPIRSGIEMINSDGLMPYLDDDIRDMILRYYTLLDQIRMREEIANTFIKTKYESYLIDQYNEIFNRTNPLGIMREYYVNDPRTPEKLNKEELLSDKKLEALVFGRIFQTQRLMELYDETLDLSSQLITRINSN